jgi:hypothetical protein
MLKQISSDIIVNSLRWYLAVDSRHIIAIYGFNTLTKHKESGISAQASARAPRILTALIASQLPFASNRSFTAQETPPRRAGSCYVIQHSLVCSAHPTRSADSSCMYLPCRNRKRKIDVAVRIPDIEAKR